MAERPSNSWNTPLRPYVPWCETYHQEEAWWWIMCHWISFQSPCWLCTIWMKCHLNTRRTTTSTFNITWRTNISLLSWSNDSGPQQRMKSSSLCRPVRHDVPFHFLKAVICHSLSQQLAVKQILPYLAFPYVRVSCWQITTTKRFSLHTSIVLLLDHKSLFMMLMTYYVPRFCSER